MRKNVFGRQFKRDTNERRSLFKSLISSLILNESIKTTEEKAKAIKGDVDKIITRAKKEENQARRLLGGALHAGAADKVIKDIAKRFSKRQGGYTRITKLGRRLSDNAGMVLMEWTEAKKVIEPVVEKPKAETKLKETKVKKSATTKKPKTSQKDK